jgi:hypothetical protein
MRMVWDNWEKEEGMGRMARKMRTREEIQPKIPLNNNHPSTTPTVCPEPMAGSLLMIHAAPQCCKRAQNSEFNKPGFSSGRPQLHTQLTPPPSKHHLAVMSWHFTSI